MMTAVLGPYFGNMPEEMAGVIFGWLDPISLCNCRRVSKKAGEIATVCLVKWLGSKGDGTLLMPPSIRCYEQVVFCQQQIKKVDVVLQSWGMPGIGNGYNSFFKTVFVWGALIGLVEMRTQEGVCDPIEEPTEANKRFDWLCENAEVFASLVNEVLSKESQVVPLDLSTEMVSFRATIMDQEIRDNWTRMFGRYDALNYRKMDLV